MLEPVGHRVLIQVKVEEETKSGIIIAREARLAKVSTEHGTVLAIGPEAWKVHNKAAGTEKPWVHVGDRVVFSKYGGRFVIDPDTDEEYMIINDDDILAKIKEEE